MFSVLITSILFFPMNSFSADSNKTNKEYPQKIFYNEVVDELSCEVIKVVAADYGKNNGSVTIKIIGGATPYQYYWVPNYAAMKDNGDQTLTFNNLKGNDSFVVYVDDNNGNSCFCGTYITTTPDALFCTYGIGFWGNKNSNGCLNGNQQSSNRLMEQALINAGYDPVFGHDGASFTLTSNDIASGKVYKILPGGGPSKPFTGNALFVDKSTWPYIPLSTKKANEGKSQNSLFSQMLALFFNLNINPGLESLIIENPVLITLPVSCQSGEVINQTDEKFSTIPTSVFEFLINSSYSQTAGGLFNLANDALGGVETGLLLSDIADGLAALNKAFDGCRTLVGWKEAPTPRTSDHIFYEPQSLEVYPNPFSGKVYFEFVPGQDAQAKLELFDILGQKIKTLMYIPVNKGMIQKLGYLPQGINSGFLFYRLTLGNQVTSGKVLYIK